MCICLQLIAHPAGMAPSPAATFPETALAPAILFLVLFAIVSLANGVVTVYTRVWFMLIVAGTGFLEAAGYIARISVHHRPGVANVISMQVLLIISPSFLILSNSLVVTNIMKVLQLKKVVIKTGCVSCLFFGFEILCFFMQAGGATISVPKSGNTDSQNAVNAHFGKILLLVGLSIQLALMVLFLAFTAYVNKATDLLVFGKNHKSLHMIYIGLYATTGLLVGRNIFRFVEFIQGFAGNLATHEVYLYIFDAIPILGCVVLFTFLHFGIHRPTANVDSEQEGFKRVEVSTSIIASVPV